MRALLVVNPIATATTQRVRDVLVNALAADLTLEVAQTKGRGHAVELGERAADTGMDLVIALGGDGTANEIVNGLLRDGPAPGGPALAVVPGGSTNVLARSLGYPRSAVEATGELLEALREGRSRRIGIGRASFDGQSRWFTFCAGVGVDAAVVRRVERRRAKGRRNTPGLYLRAAVWQFVRSTGRPGPRVMVEVEEAADDGVPTSPPEPNPPEPNLVVNAIVCNTAPWTYLNGRGVFACPEASFDHGLDLLALRRARVSTALRTSAQMLGRNGRPHGRNLLTLHDQARLTVTCDEPIPFQVDGEFLGCYSDVTLTSIPLALRVIA